MEGVTAEEETDYKALTTPTFVFTDSVSQTKDASITIYTNFADEGLEVFKMVISSSSEGTGIAEPAEATVIINDSGMYNV